MLSPAGARTTLKLSQSKAVSAASATGWSVRARHATSRETTLSAIFPPPGTQVQVLRFDRAGQQVYQERIMVPLGNFADPLPSAVTRARATLVTCADGGGAPLWCLQSGAQPGVPTGTQPGLRWLDGS